MALRGQGSLQQLVGRTFKKNNIRKREASASNPASELHTAADKQASQEVLAPESEDGRLDGQVRCPVCCARLADDNFKVNQHVDLCLVTAGQRNNGKPGAKRRNLQKQQSTLHYFAARRPQQHPATSAPSLIKSEPSQVSLASDRAAAPTTRTELQLESSTKPFAQLATPDPLRCSHPWSPSPASRAGVPLPRPGCADGAQSHPRCSLPTLLPQQGNRYLVQGGHELAAHQHSRQPSCSPPAQTSPSVGADRGSIAEQQGQPHSCSLPCWAPHAKLSPAARPSPTKASPRGAAPSPCCTLATFQSMVVGRRYQSSTVRCQAGQRVLIAREEDNPRDPHALLVLPLPEDAGPSPASQRGSDPPPSPHTRVPLRERAIGHLPGSVARHLAPLLRWHGAEVEGVVLEDPPPSDRAPLPLELQVTLPPPAVRTPSGKSAKRAQAALQAAQQAAAQHAQQRQGAGERLAINFLTVLHTVLRYDGHLLDEAERGLASTFQALPPPAAALLLRLFLRRGPWFRVGTLSYAEVPDVHAALGALCEAGLAQAVGTLPLPPCPAGGAEEESTTHGAASPGGGSGEGDCDHAERAGGGRSMQQEAAPLQGSGPCTTRAMSAHPPADEVAGAGPGAAVPAEHPFTGGSATCQPGRSSQGGAARSLAPPQLQRGPASAQSSAGEGWKEGSDGWEEQEGDAAGGLGEARVEGGGTRAAGGGEGRRGPMGAEVLGVERGQRGEGQGGGCPAGNASPLAASPPICWRQLAHLLTVPELGAVLAARWAPLTLGEGPPAVPPPGAPHFPPPRDSSSSSRGGRRGSGRGKAARGTTRLPSDAAVPGGRVAGVGRGQLVRALERWAARDQEGVRLALLHATGDVVRLSETCCTAIDRIQRLFFLNEGHTLSQFLAADLGGIRYPQYPVHRSRSAFATRGALLAYEAALRHAERLSDALEAGDVGEAERVLAHAWAALDSGEHKLQGEDGLCGTAAGGGAGGVPLFLRRFTAGWVYCTMATVGVSIMEKGRDYRGATARLRQLLGGVCCRGRRGEWWLRLSVDTEHMGRAEEALEVAEAALADEWVQPGDRLALQRRVLRLGKPPRRWRRPHWAEAAAREPRERRLEGRPLSSTVGLKSRFYGLDGEQCGVEELALQYYASVEGGGWQGVHSEGGIWATLFGLLMWEVLFMAVPDVLRTPFQTAPLDLDSDGFFPARKSAIEDVLGRISAGSAPAMLAHTWQAQYGVLCRGVSWERYKLEDLQVVAECVGGPGLAAVCRLLAEDHAGWTGGMPDLLLWNPQRRAALLSEVKGPRDRLSDQQRAWMNELAASGLEVEVLKVTEPLVGAKSKKPRLA